ncbi:MAG TPA: EAL domain-containing protein [Tahibacter sp.]|nr:EAL domain-containing protein [Tahibacter sp.]
MTTRCDDAVRVLIVDDDEEDFILARAMFAEIVDFRAVVAWASTFENGLEIARRDGYDVYLVDYLIGPETGVAWIEEARRHGITAPIILLTGHGSHEVDVAAMAAGAADYLVKSQIDTALLGRCVRYALDRERYSQAIRASERRHRLLFERSPMPMWVYDAKTLKFLAVNDAAVAHYGYSHETFLAMTLDDVRVENWRDSPRLSDTSATPAGHATPSRHIRHDGTFINVEVFADWIEFGEQPARLVLINDVTAKLAAEEHTRLLARAFESSQSGMLIADLGRPDMPSIYVNPAFARLTGYPVDEILGRNCRFLQGDDTRQPEIDTIREAIKHRTECNVVLRNYRKDGSLFWHQLTLAPVHDPSGKATHYIGVSTDLTERRRYEAELAYLARHDIVTSLPRYVDADESFEPLLREAKQRGERVSVFYLDIDRFHSVNETMGYRAGDEMLRLVAQRLRFAVAEDGVLWRVSGDEFVIALRYARGRLEPLAFADKLRDALEQPFLVSTYQRFLSASIGIASYPINTSRPEELFNYAEAAMMRAKRNGRNSVHHFGNEQADELRDRLAIGGRLRDAVRNGELVLHYQPQVSSHDSRIIGMEALVRWDTPDWGLLPPKRFIGLAEELGLIVDLGRWVLREACREARGWQDIGCDDVRVAVNVSALQLQRPTFIEDVCEALESSGLPAHRLELEITESAIMENVDRSTDIMNALRKLGVHLALDDFGIGYSSLAHLRRFPIDKLKIDQSFVRDVALESGEAAIVRAITAMGHELRLKVMAEGVETAAQIGYLRRNHCDEFQGYAFGEPVPAERARVLLKRRFIGPDLDQTSSPERGLLLVDDEENVLRALGRALRRDGYRIFSASSAEQGFDILARHSIQVILSDQRMPVMNGTDFLSKVKEMYPDTVRMVLSGHTDVATVTDAINLGAIYKFLTKPWNDDDLRQQISDAFRTHELRRATPHERSAS